MIDVSARVQAIVADRLGLPLEEVAWSSHFTEDLAADSLDRLELRLAIEEAFGVRITDDQQDAFVRVGDVIQYLERQPEVTA